MKLNQANIMDTDKIKTDLSEIHTILTKILFDRPSRDDILERIESAEEKINNLQNYVYQTTV